MPKLIMLVILAVAVAACGGEQGEANAAQADAGTKKKREPKWEILVDGRPELSGRVITAVTAGGFGNYSMASSDTTISVQLDQDNPGSMVNIKYNDDDVRCMNFGDAQVVADGDKGRITGEVGCFGPDQKPDDHQKATIDGWFELNK